jgi:hypothetical protein
MKMMKGQAVTRQGEDVYACLYLSCYESIITRHHCSIATLTFVHVFENMGIENRTDWIG